MAESILRLHAGWFVNLREREREKGLKVYNVRYVWRKKKKNRDGKSPGKRFSSQVRLGKFFWIETYLHEVSRYVWRIFISSLNIQYFQIEMYIMYMYVWRLKNSDRPATPYHPSVDSLTFSSQLCKLPTYAIYLPLLPSTYCWINRISALVIGLLVLVRDTQYIILSPSP